MIGPMAKPSQEIRDLESVQSSASRLLRHIVEKTEPADTRNQAAVALGRLGASKGGKARAKILTKKRRAEIAKAAAQARWTK